MLTAHVKFLLVIQVSAYKNHNKLDLNDCNISRQLGPINKMLKEILPELGPNNTDESVTDDLEELLEVSNH